MRSNINTSDEYIRIYVCMSICMDAILPLPLSRTQSVHQPGFDALLFPLLNRSFQH